MTTLLTLADIAAHSEFHAGRAQIFSDLHKDALGFRPRVRACMFTSVVDFDQTWDYLVRELNDSMDHEKQMQENAIARLQERVADIQSIVVNASKKDAIRIMIDSDDLSESMDWYGYENIEYCWNLPYGFITKFLGE
jgi:hypothetical protein